MNRLKFLGLKLTKLREAEFKTQQEIADMLCIKRATYAAYEEGRADPPTLISIKLCSYYKISILDLGDIKCLDRQISIY